MVLDKLGGSLRDTLSKIAKSIFVDEKLINELVKDIQRALLQADVNVRLVLKLSKDIKERVLKEKPIPGLTKKEQLINIVYDELVKFLGGEKHDFAIGSKKPFIVLMVGLFGVGKTTTSAKLARYFSKRGLKVAMVGLDVHRPASMDQLSQLANQVNVPVFIDKNEKDPVKIYSSFKDHFSKFDLIIVDTAGRDALSGDLIEEIEAINDVVNADEKLLVISGDIGQAAQKQAEQFHSSVGVTGVIATKMDGTARAGGALTACSVTKAPIKFIGVGEKIDDLEAFNPKGFVSRLLGMGDIEALLDKAKLAMTEKNAEDLGKKFLKGDFNLLDLYEQMQAVKKMGPLTKVMEMIPGFSKIPKDMLNGQEEKLDSWRYIMNSCTKKELEEPDIIDKSRMERISVGAGMPLSDIRELMKQYKQSKKMMKMMKGKNPEKIMSRLKF